MALDRKYLQVRNTLHTTLLVLAAVALYLLAERFPWQIDFTQNSGNSLEPATQQVLKNLAGPVHVKVFVPEQDAKQGDLRSVIRRFVALYQRQKRDLTLEFFDPAQNPDEARQAEISSTGELVIEFDGRREHLTTLNEQAFTSALFNLAHRSSQQTMYTSGHGERKLDGMANFDLGDFGNRLNRLGYRISSLNLTIAQDVPDNTGLLVITQPQADWLPGEIDKVLRYIDRGGNLLWLLDSEPMHGLEPLAEGLGVSLTPGIVLDPDSAKLRAPVTWALGASYPPHPVTRDFNLITAFPYARALGHEDNKKWHYTSLVDAAPHGWVSEKIPKGNTSPKFNKNADIPGPVSIALALEREAASREQRIVVVGSGAFLSNSYVGNGGNLNLGINIVDWLNGQEKLIIASPRSTRDTQLTLSTVELGAITITLIIVLPLLLALTGGLLWLRRRK